MKNKIQTAKKLIISSNFKYKKTHEEFLHITSNYNIKKKRNTTFDFNTYYNEFVKIIENKNKGINAPINLLLTKKITEIIEKAKIECLTNYGFEGNKYNLFKCKIGHIFMACSKHIVSKKDDRNICFKCSRSTEENICASIFEYIFEKEFIKIRPNWLDDNEDNKLELDGYCKISK